MANLNSMLDTKAGPYLTVTPNITAAGLAMGGNIPIFTAVPTGQYRIIDININLTGANFSGGGGDRDISLTDGVNDYTIIPAATIQSLLNARWGSTNVPLPTGA